MPLLAEPVPVGVTLPAGPVTPDFRQAIETALAGMIPPGRKGALLGVATSEGLVFGIAARLNEHWTLGGDVDLTWNGDVKGRVMVVGSW